MSSQSRRGLRAGHARSALFLAIIALAFVLVWKTGWAAIQANLASIGWWFVGLTALYLVAEIAFVLGWRSVMEPTGVAYGLVRPGRELLWVLPGLVFLARRPAAKKADLDTVASGTKLAGIGQAR